MSLIGNTPLVEIKVKFKGEEKNIYAKLEWYNLTGSIKDRVAEQIILSSYENGTLKHGQPIVEATSGNTGISFAGLGAKLGHKVYIFMPDWVSKERIKIIRSYGGEVFVVSAKEGGFKEAIRRADEFAKKIGGFLPNQFDNKYNFLAHYYGTGEEIVDKLTNIDCFVSGFGTGGTLMGVGKRIKASFPEAKIIALEPKNMTLLGRDKKIGRHKIQGIGDDFIPALMDVDAIDDFISISDNDAINMSKILSQKLGLGVGISSGANFLASLKQREENILTIFPDDNKKYLSTPLATPLTSPLSKQIQFLNIREI